MDSRTPWSLGPPRLNAPQEESVTRGPTSRRCRTLNRPRETHTDQRGRGRGRERNDQ